MTANPVLRRTGDTQRRGRVLPTGVRWKCGSRHAEDATVNSFLKPIGMAELPGIGRVGRRRRNRFEFGPADRNFGLSRYATGCQDALECRKCPCGHHLLR